MRTVSGRDSLHHRRGKNRDRQIVLAARDRRISPPRAVMSEIPTRKHHPTQDLHGSLKSPSSFPVAATTMVAPLRHFGGRSRDLPYNHRSSTCDSTASAWDSQKVMSMARYSAMAAESSVRACSRWPAVAYSIPIWVWQCAWSGRLPNSSAKARASWAWAAASALSGGSRRAAMSPRRQRAYACRRTCHQIASVICNASTQEPGGQRASPALYRSSSQASRPPAG